MHPVIWLTCHGSFSPHRWIPERFASRLLPCPVHACPHPVFGPWTVSCVCFLCGTAFAVLPPFVSCLAKSSCDPFAPLALQGCPAVAPGRNRVSHGSTLPYFDSGPLRRAPIRRCPEPVSFDLWCLCGVIFFSSSGFQCSLSLSVLRRFSASSFLSSFFSRCALLLLVLPVETRRIFPALRTFFLPSFLSSLLLMRLSPLCEPPLPALPAPSLLMPPFFAFTCV